MESYDFDEGFSKLIDRKLEGVDTLELRRLATYVGMNEHTTATIDKLDEEEYASLQRALITVAAEGADAERGRFALRLLANVGQRSERHAGALPVSVLPSIRDLLMGSRHVPECAALLTMSAGELARTAALDPNLDTIVATVGHLWMSVEDDGTRSWLSAFVARLLELDGAFLANAFGELPSSAFTNLLHITEALCDGMVMGARAEGEFRMHPNNAQMLVDIVRRAHFDYTDEAREGPSTTTSSSSARFLPEYPNQLPLLLGCIASLATRRDLFGDVLQREGNEALVDCIVEMLDVTLHAEGCLQRAEETGEEEEERRPEDRPQRAPAFDSPRVLSSPSLSRMAAAFCKDASRQRAKERIGAMKCATVRAIGNLSAECASSRLRAGAGGAVVLCLAAARRRDHDDAFVTQWSIAALRYLCLGCPENQEILAAIDSAPTGIIDRDGLLAQLGLRVVTVEEEDGAAGPKKRAKLMPL
ncbi:hypothetical protein PRIPAC_84729 [Pristionchus pacificus]|uniref:Ataxin-10 domain-containing protein n=1 Tax=Pristionchus pacificus TaxID=54126 RepID=A0A8R1V503_PRIPA|nr:hypothetical protein PRIPAC_84729 [Pristionchus pacificus]